MKKFRLLLMLVAFVLVAIATPYSFYALVEHAVARHAVDYYN